MNARKVFVSYAPEDQEAFQEFIKQSMKENLPFELVYTPVKEAWDEAWRNETKQLIKQSDSILVLISKNIKVSESAFWEMKCSNESGKPMLSMFLGGAGIMDKPMDIRSVTAMVLNWDRLKDFVERL